MAPGHAQGRTRSRLRWLPLRPCCRPFDPQGDIRLGVTRALADGDDINTLIAQLAGMRVAQRMACEHQLSRLLAMAIGQCLPHLATKREHRMITQSRKIRPVTA